jgi:hypothetical protein
VADCPAVTLALEGDALTAKPVAVTLIVVDGVKVTPLLVALSVTVFEPGIQSGAGVDPMPPPQVPVQL